MRSFFHAAALLAVTCATIVLAQNNETAPVSVFKTVCGDIMITQGRITHTVTASAFKSTST
jgi:hypothetical protein